MQNAFTFQNYLHLHLFLFYITQSLFSQMIQCRKITNQPVTLYHAVLWVLCVQSKNNTKNVTATAPPSQLQSTHLFLVLSLNPLILNSYTNRFYSFANYSHYCTTKPYDNIFVTGYIWIYIQTCVFDSLLNLIAHWLVLLFNGRSIDQTRFISF